MKTPQEVVEQFMPKEIEVLHVYREALENWVPTIQQDAFESGWKRGMEDSMDMKSKGVDPNRAIDASRPPATKSDVEVQK